MELSLEYAPVVSSTLSGKKLPASAWMASAVLLLPLAVYGTGVGPMVSVRLPGIVLTHWLWTVKPKPAVQTLSDAGYASSTAPHWHRLTWVAGQGLLVVQCGAVQRHSWRVCTSQQACLLCEVTQLFSIQASPVWQAAIVQHSAKNMRQRVMSAEWAVLLSQTA